MNFVKICLDDDQWKDTVPCALVESMSRSKIPD